MSTITIPAREVKARSGISVAGVKCTVTKVETMEPTSTTIWYRAVERAHTPLSHYFMVRPDELVEAEVTDPDAELIEVMAKAYRDALGLRHHVSGWDDLGIDNQIGVRADMRAALAAAREAGLL